MKIVRGVLGAIVHNPEMQAEELLHRHLPTETAHGQPLFHPVNLTEFSLDLSHLRPAILTAMVVNEFHEHGFDYLQSR